MKPNRIAKGVLIFIAIAAIFFLVVALVMTLWNCILPDVLGVKEISFWQAAGILVLSKILFGGFKGGRNKFKDCRPGWKQRIEHLSPEEKERFKEKLRERFGNSPFCRRD